MKAIAALSMKVASAIFSYIFIYLLSQSMSLKDMGVFLFSYTVFTVLVQVSKSGIDLVLIKLVAVYENFGDVKKILFANMLLILCLSSMAATVLLLIAYLNFFEVIGTRDRLYGFSSIMLSVVFISVTQVFGAYFQSRLKVIAQYWAMNVGLMLLLCLVLAVAKIINFELNFLRVSFLFLICSFVVLISVAFGLFYIFRSEITSITSVPESNAGLLLVLKNNSPYIFASLLTIFLQWMPNLMGGMFLTEEELAGLGVSLRLSIATNFPFLAFVALTGPVIAVALKNKTYDYILSSYKEYHFISVLFASIVLFFFLMFSTEILDMFNVSGFDVLLVLCTFSWWIRVVAGPVGTILMLEGEYSSAIISLFFSVILSTLIFYILYDFYGVTSAGVALIAGAAQLSIQNGLTVYKKTGIVFSNPKYMMMGFKATVFRFHRIVKRNYDKV